MSEITDEIVMQHVKDGNLEEMSVLFERYHLKLFNFFLKLTRDRVVSQDLTQNLFYRMIKYKNSYRPDLSVKSWIYQMARNLHTDYYRDEKKKTDLFQRAESYTSNVTDETGEFHEEDYERLREAFSGLSEEQKEIIILSRYQGLKYEEISEITSQSVAAIKVAMHRAIKQLRVIYFKQV